MGLTLRFTTSGTGAFAVAGLHPGIYTVRAEFAGFTAAVAQVKVEVGRETRADVRLQIGTTQETVAVNASDVRPSITSAALDGVIQGAEIRRQPLNGRQFLELAQLEPGVQVNDGGAVIGLKEHYAGVSMNGRSGLTTRVTVDGLDISDELLGSITQNVSLDAIEEFQISRSMSDSATGIGGSGAVNIATRSGTNQLHGSGFVFWRDSALAAKIGGQDFPFDREQGGFALGAPLLRNHLFAFVSYERNNRDSAVATDLPGFPQFSRTWPWLYDEEMSMARVDANLPRGVRVFARFSHNGNSGSSTDVSSNAFSPQDQHNNSSQTAAGLDLTAGRSTHSFRFGFLNYHFYNRDGIPLIPGLADISYLVGRGASVALNGLSGAVFGTNANSPARRLQKSYELRYDGGFNAGRHLLRWGLESNQIKALWFSPVFSTPRIALTYNATNAAICGSDVFCYPIQGGQIGNGLGYLSEKPGFGLPYGAFSNNRFGWYAADSWRIHNRVNVTAAVRYSVEPGQDNSDLTKPAVLELFQPGLSQPNRVEHDNFSPRLGLTWSPSASGRWVVRAGAGLFYDTKLLRDRRWERVNLLPAGVGSVSQQPQNRKVTDPLTGATIFDFTGLDKTALVTPGINWQNGCKDPRFPAGQCPLSTPGFVDAYLATSQAFIAAYARAMQQYPVGPSVCEDRRTCNTFASDFQSPYVIQFNVGVQRELRRGLLLSADYVHHRGLHSLLAPDANLQGAADTLNPAAATAAMNSLHASLGCPPGPSGVNCAIAKKAKIASYAGRGLGANPNATATALNNATFPGNNLQFNQVNLHSMTGRSRYNALQFNIRGRMPEMGNILRDWTVIGSYSLSRYEGTAGDQDLWYSEDFKPKGRPDRFYGPTTLDRTHIFTLSSSFVVPGGVELSSIWRMSSALPQSVFVPTQAAGTAEIFMTDFDGDGATGDPLPGTNRGSYGRDIGCGAAALNRYIDQYNAERAGKPTPAGRALIDAGLFTEPQLVSIGAVAPVIARAPQGQVCLDSFITTDVRIARPVKLRKERVTIEPAWEWFNVFNVANFDVANNLTSGLNGSIGSLNGTTAADRRNRAALLGSFSGGSPRSWQLAVRVTF